MGLVSDVRRLQKSPISKVVRKRLAEFKKLGKSDNWFSELCFCILTANSKARTAIAIQKKLGAKGFSSMSASTTTRPATSAWRGSLAI